LSRWSQYSGGARAVLTRPVRPCCVRPRGPPAPLTDVAAPPADELVNEKEKYKGVADEMDTAFAELSGY